MPLQVAEARGFVKTFGSITEAVEGVARSAAPYSPHIL